MSAAPLNNSNFIGLLCANTILAAAMPMLIILGGLAGMNLAPSLGLATFPPSVQILAGLLGAGPMSWFMGKFGRRSGFALSGCLAALGGGIAALGLFQSSFLLLCLGHMALGAALAGYQYFRFAAAEVVSDAWQPVAISLMLTSGLVAAFAGPQVFILAKDLIANAPLAGAYIAISALSMIGLVPLAFVRIAAPVNSATKAPVDRGAALSVLRRGPVLSAVLIGAVSQGVMVLLMAPTPVAMIGHGMSEAVAGDVIRWHVVAMFAPSFFTGFLIKRFGTEPIVISGLCLLIASAIIAAHGLTPHHFYGALILLGLGWNFGYIGATQMLIKAASPEERSLVQGTNDTLIALAATICAFSGGAIIAGYGWTVLALCAIPFILIGILSVAMSRYRRPALDPAP